MRKYLNSKVVIKYVFLRSFLEEVYKGGYFKYPSFLKNSCLLAKKNVTSTKDISLP